MTRRQRGPGATRCARPARSTNCGYCVRPGLKTRDHSSLLAGYQMHLGQADRGVALVAGIAICFICTVAGLRRQPGFQVPFPPARGRSNVAVWLDPEDPPCARKPREDPSLFAESGDANSARTSILRVPSTLGGPFPCLPAIVAWKTTLPILPTRHPVIAIALDDPVQCGSTVVTGVSRA